MKVTLEELDRRVTIPEAWKETVTHSLRDIRAAQERLEAHLYHQDQKLDHLRQDLSQKIERYREETQVEIRGLRSEMKEELGRVWEQIGALRNLMVRLFLWSLGLQFGILISLILLLIRGR